jgi:hypothetical protein
MSATRSLAVVTALAGAIVAGHDALGQAPKSGGANQMTLQDSAGSEAARVNKVDALTIKQNAAEGAAHKDGAAAQAEGSVRKGALKLNPLDDAAIKGESAAHKAAAAHKDAAHKGAAAHKDAAAIKGESKDGTTGILIGLTPKPEADASMAGGAKAPARAGAAGVIAPIDHKAAGVVAPIDHRARAVSAGDYKPLATPGVPSVGTAQAVPRSAPPAQTALPAVQVPAVQAPATQQSLPAVQSPSFGGPATQGVIKK